MTNGKHKAGGCGCGGSSGGKCAGCCGSQSFPGKPIEATSCDTCEEQAFVRPRFFAGQLLTEDDLEALNAYVIGKNRLHNSRLWGDGVVCGLEVVCGPCGGDTVVVRPGYALDCCGNDLVLTCDRELDIGDMIASLREQLHPGHNCGHPCVEDTKHEPCIEPSETSPKNPDAQRAKVKRTARAMRSMMKPDGTLDDAQLDQPESKHPDEYCLYIRYHETPTEPTAPYPVGDECGTTACEATRVVEGVRFELRCPTNHDDRDDLFARLMRFLGELSPDGKLGDEIRFLQYFARTAGSALRRLEHYEKTKTVELDDEYLDRRTFLRARLDDPSTAGDERVEYLAEWIAEGGGELRPQGHGKGKKQAPIEHERTYFDEAEKKFGRPVEGDLLYAHLGKESLPLYHTLREKTPKLDEIDDPVVRLYSLGWAHTPEMSRRVWTAIANVRTAFLRVQLAEVNQTDCLHTSELTQLSIAEPARSERTAVPDLELLLRITRRLLRIAFAMFAERVCIDATPPCPECSDPSVLLACVKVVGCKVIEICNFERKFVLGPRALRHWLPPINWLGDIIEELCCATGYEEDEGKYQYEAARKLMAARGIGKRPDLAMLAQAASSFYARTAQPVAVNKTIRALVPGAFETKVSDETHVSRSEMYKALDALRAELKGG